MKTNKKLIGLFILMLALMAVSLCSCVHEHSFNSWITSNEASCTTTGTEFRTCLSCDYIETRTIPAKGHNEVKIAAVSPTCTKAGNEEGVKCSYCDVVFSGAKTIPAKGHNENTLGFCTVCKIDVLLDELKRNFDIKLNASSYASTCSLSFKNGSKYSIKLLNAEDSIAIITDLQELLYAYNGSKNDLILAPNYKIDITYYCNPVRTGMFPEGPLDLGNLGFPDKVYFGSEPVVVTWFWINDREYGAQIDKNGVIKFMRDTR